MGQFANYEDYLVNEADSFVQENLDEIIDDVKEGNTNLYEYVNDSRIHEWVDSDFIYVDLMDCAEILEQSDNIETDDGLWDGQEPREAIKTQAFFTYRNDLYVAVKDKLEEILEEKSSKLEEELEDVQNDIYVYEELDELTEEQEEKLEELREKEQDLEGLIDNLHEAVNTL